MKLFLCPSELLDDWALPTETLILSQFHPPFYSCISGAVELVACFCEIYVILIWWGALSRFYLNSYLSPLSVLWSCYICCYCQLCEAAIFVAIVSCVKLPYLLLSPFVWSYHIYCYCQMCEATIFVAVVSCVKLPYLLLLSVLWSYCICCYCHLCEATIFAALSVVWSYHIRQKYFLLYWLLFIFKTFWYCVSRAIKLPFSKERHVAKLTLSNILT